MDEDSDSGNDQGDMQMKRRDLESHLRNHGCIFVRHEGKHDFWANPVTGLLTSVPRHREILMGTARAICRQLEIPEP